MRSDHLSPLPGLRLQSFSLSLLRTTFGLRWSRIPEFAGNIIILLSSLSRRIEAMPTTRSRDDFRVRHVCSWQILLRKSAAADGRSANHLGAMGFDPRPRRSVRNFYATQCTKPQRVAVAQLAMRAAAGSGRWQPEQIRPGRLVDHAVEAGRASECASSARTAANRPRKLLSEARFVGMTNPASSKHLKTLERVKGIEPSYPAWKTTPSNGPLRKFRRESETVREARGAESRLLNRRERRKCLNDFKTRFKKGQSAIRQADQGRPVLEPVSWKAMGVARFSRSGI